MLQVDPTRPLDPLTSAVLGDFHGVATDQGVPYFVCGAMARDILAWHVHGVPAPRATRDVDLAFAVPSWGEFQTLKSALGAKHGYLGNAKSPWRIRPPGMGEAHGYAVDLIPFGGIEAPAGEIAWPPDSEIIMNVIGFNDALESTSTVTVAPGLGIPVVSLPMLAILKLLAWNDRRRHTTKDARDFAFLLTSYEKMLDTTRLYDEEQAILAAVDYDLEQAGARILGRDAARMISPATSRVVLTILGSDMAHESLITEIAAAISGRADAVEAAGAHLRQFELGLAAGSP